MKKKRLIPIFNNALLFDGMAKHYGVLPSQLLHTDWEDYQINFLCYEVGIKDKIKRHKQEQNKMRKGKFRKGR